MAQTLLGVDTGGTFTDFVVLDSHGVRTHKVLSTPDAPERAILQGTKELGLDLYDLQVVHGSTVATNAVLEGKGVPVVYVTNKGLKDVLTIGRQNRKELYNLNPQPDEPPVPEGLCLEVDARMTADGSELKTLTETELKALIKKVQDSNAQAVAINLLFSYLNPDQEKQIESALPQGLFISRSSKVLAEYREYERGIATWINASVGPLMEGYLQRLRDGLAPAKISVMQSTGGTISVDQAAEHAVRLLLSGPAGGLMGARYMGQLAGRNKLLTFDMGGTSTDVALIDGELSLSSEGHMGRYPIAVPMVDMHTIGAGGGSLASCDSGGLLQVGPESAGASPGPACYGKGGKQATVTDANVVLGRIPNLSALGGSLTLDNAAATQALNQLAETLSLKTMEAAEGVIRLANEHMARALRVISVERGVDVGEYTLTCFGGAGGLHVCALAELMNMTQALVPVNGGVLSALGMLVAPARRETSLTLNVLLQDVDADKVQEQFEAEKAELLRELIEEGLVESTLQIHRLVDLRYRGQSSTLQLPWCQDIEILNSQFHQKHKEQYGHEMDMAVELVNIRVSASGPEPELPLQQQRGESGGVACLGHVEVFGHGEVPCYQRERLPSGVMLKGPAVIVEKVATTWLDAGWGLEVDVYGNLVLGKE